MNRIKVFSGVPYISPHRRKGLAFSLVEVVLSLGVISFALLSMLALLPVGIQSTRDSLKETGAIDVLSSVIADRRGTIDPSAHSVLYGLPPLTAASSNTFGVTAANTNSTAMSQSLYRVICVVTPPSAGRLDPYQVYFKVSWPPAVASAAASEYIDETVTFPQP